MIDLFKWGFVLAMAATWVAIGVGALMLLLPAKPPARRQPAAVEEKRAA